MHPPEAHDPADRSDGAQYQRHCFEFCMENCIMMVAPALCATAFTSWRFPDQPNQPDNDHDYCGDPQNVQSERSNGECQTRDHPDNDQQHCDPKQRMFHTTQSRTQHRLRLFWILSRVLRPERGAEDFLLRGSSAARDHCASN
jgi:hypothetical protein